MPFPPCAREEGEASAGGWQLVRQDVALFGSRSAKLAYLKWRMRCVRMAG